MQLWPLKHNIIYACRLFTGKFLDSDMPSIEFKKSGMCVSWSEPSITEYIFSSLIQFVHCGTNFSRCYKNNQWIAWLFLKQSLWIVQIHNLHVANSQSEWSAKQIPWAEITQLILPHSMFIIASMKNTLIICIWKNRWRQPIYLDQLDGYHYNSVAKVWEPAGHIRVMLNTDWCMAIPIL